MWLYTMNELNSLNIAKANPSMPHHVHRAIKIHTCHYLVLVDPRKITAFQYRIEYSKPMQKERENNTPLSATTNHPNDLKKKCSWQWASIIPQNLSGCPMWILTITVLIGRSKFQLRYNKIVRITTQLCTCGLHAVQSRHPSTLDHAWNSKSLHIPARLSSRLPTCYARVQLLTTSIARENCKNILYIAQQSTHGWKFWKLDRRRVPPHKTIWLNCDIAASPMIFI